jgi:ribonuclease-3
VEKNHTEARNGMSQLLPESHFHHLGRRLGHTFNQPTLLVQAFQHASYVNEQDDTRLENNERLEFLGDAVLDLAVSHFLMDRYPEANEGQLSKYRAMLVGESGLYEIARELKLGQYLLLGKGEEQSNGREKPSILANTLEALVGAVYLDAGFDRTLAVLRRLLWPMLEDVASKALVTDFKSMLQEYTQETAKTVPTYRLEAEIGPPHDKTFRVALILNGERLADGEGKSKKEAEQNAAREAFHCLVGS